jgi:flagellar basal body-associated protein FliL
MPVRALLALILVFALGAGSAFANEGEGASGELGNTVTLPTLIAPMVEGQRLTGYVYVSIRLTAASSSDADHLRDVLPRIQDALLRALNDSPLPAAEADSPASKIAMSKTVTDALHRLGDIQGIEDVAFADYQPVPF